MSYLARACVLGMMLCIPAFSTAQEASIAGTVSDESKAMLPGVTITARDSGNGRTFMAVSDSDGAYHLLGMSPGRYELRAELPGFATSLLSDIQLLVGQNATVTFSLKVAALEESITVSGTAPLVDMRNAQVSGNVDRRQMQELPIQGRNWMSLTAMVKGVTSNTISTTPGVATISQFQLNLDGQEITQSTASTGFGQPGISRDAIAEYQVVTNLFDVTMGRSSGLQVQAISKSGTNKFGGSLYGYFRDDALTGKDFFTHTKLPYANQQVGGTFGGPIVRDKVHFFASYEHEREPSTVVSTPAALGGQTMNFPIKTDINNVLARLDYQVSPASHFTARGTVFTKKLPSDGMITHPTRGSQKTIDSQFATFNWSQILSNRTLQEVKVGYYNYYWTYAGMEGLALTLEYNFPGLVMGLNWNYPENIGNRRIPIRYDLKSTRGKHDLKLGGEFIFGKDSGWWRARERGQFFFSSLPANAATRFPLAEWNNPAAYDFSGLDSTVVRFDKYYASNWDFNVPRPTTALWIGDTWTLSDRITLNLGVRYDLPWGDLAPPGVTETSVVINNGLFTEDVGYRNDIRDTNNVAPRFGFTVRPTEGDLVIRGGTGLFYGNDGANQAYDQQLFNGQKVIANSYTYDGRPGFILDPTRGITADDVLSGRVPLSPQSINVIGTSFQMPYTWQTILGFQKQLGEVTGFDADLIFQKGYNEDSQRDANLFYDPVTGYNKNPVTAGRPRTDYGPIGMRESRGRSEYAALATSFTRRYRNNFQFGATYTYMFMKNDMGPGTSGYGGAQVNPFDINDNWARATDFQRHTFRFNGIFRLPLGVTAASLFSYGSGNYGTLSSGADPTGIGASRIRPNFTLLDRNTFHQDAWQQLDVRLTKDISVKGITYSGIMEVFNVYNFDRFNYNLIETSRLFGTPTSAGNTPRAVQLAFRVAF